MMTGLSFIQDTKVDVPAMTFEFFCAGKTIQLPTEARVAKWCGFSDHSNNFPAPQISVVGELWINCARLNMHNYNKKHAH
jgi:hypothetical protein